jgi:hypothetical protein
MSYLARPQPLRFHYAILGGSSVFLVRYGAWLFGCSHGVFLGCGLTRGTCGWAEFDNPPEPPSARVAGLDYWGSIELILNRRDNALATSLGSAKTLFPTLMNG